jgi:hypothetical protein
MFQRHLILLATASLFIVSSVGCGGSDPSKRVVGKWELSTEHLREAMNEEMKKKSAGKSEEEMGAAFGAAMMEGMLAQMKMSFDFKPDGKLMFAVSMMGQDKSEEGTWEFVRASGDSVTLKIGMNDKESEPATIKFIDNDTIEISPPSGQAGAAPPAMAKIVMTRVK